MRLHFCMVLLCDSQNIFSLAMLARRIAVWCIGKKDVWKHVTRPSRISVKDIPINIWKVEVTILIINHDLRPQPLPHLSDINSRDVNFPEFYFSIREFQILRLVEYSKHNAVLGVDDALNAWMLQLSRYHATRLWLGIGPWEVERRMGSCGGVKLQSTPVSLMYSCLVRPDR